MISAGAEQYITLAQLDNDNSLADWAEPLMTFFEIFFNLLIILWIVITTVRSMKLTRAKGSNGTNPEKAALYMRLLIIFAVITFVIVVLFFADIGLDWAGTRDYAMSWQWLFSSVWDWVYFSLSIYCAWVWQPTADNTRYAYLPLEEVDDTKNQELEVEAVAAPAPSPAADAKKESSSSSGS